MFKIHFILYKSSTFNITAACPNHHRNCSGIYFFSHKCSPFLAKQVKLRFSLSITYFFSLLSFFFFSPSCFHFFRPSLQLCHKGQDAGHPFPLLTLIAAFCQYDLMKLILLFESPFGKLEIVAQFSIRIFLFFFYSGLKQFELVLI